MVFMMTRAMGYELMRSAIPMNRSLSVPSVADESDAFSGLPAKRALVVRREVRNRVNRTDAVDTIATRQERPCQRYCRQRRLRETADRITHHIQDELDDPRVYLHVAHVAIAPRSRVLAKVVQRRGHQRRSEAHDERSDDVPPLET
jgi:hypothetical protein